MILLIGLCYAELGAMFPLSGGVVRFPHMSFGSLRQLHDRLDHLDRGVAIAPIEVEGALQYATKYAAVHQTHTRDGAPVHTLTGSATLVAVAALAIFVVINYIGVRWFARVNNVARVVEARRSSRSSSSRSS